MFSIFKLGTAIRKLQKRSQLLNIYYPKNIYEPLARREMKIILTQFNDLFYEAYPEMLKGHSPLLIEHEPRTHARKYDVQRDITLYRTQKVRRKALVKIEEYLHVKYITEEQIDYYKDMMKKAEQTKMQMSDEQFSSYFPQLFDERVHFLESIITLCGNKIEALEEEKLILEQTIYELVHYPDSFLRDAGRLIGGMVADSVKHVVDVVDQSFRKK